MLISEAENQASFNNHYTLLSKRSMASGRSHQVPYTQVCNTERMIWDISGPEDITYQIQQLGSVSPFVFGFHNNFGSTDIMRGKGGGCADRLLYSTMMTFSPITPQNITNTALHIISATFSCCLNPTI